MENYCPENEKKKRDYVFFLEAVLGKQGGTIDAALRAIGALRDIEQLQAVFEIPRRASAILPDQATGGNRPRWQASERGDPHHDAEAPAADFRVVK